MSAAFFIGLAGAIALGQFVALELNRQVNAWLERRMRRLEDQAEAEWKADRAKKRAALASIRYSEAPKEDRHAHH